MNGSPSQFRCDDRFRRRPDVCRLAHHSTQSKRFLVAKAVKARVEELQAARINPYPRSRSEAISAKVLHKHCEGLENGQTKNDIQTGLWGRPQTTQSTVDLSWLRISRTSRICQDSWQLPVLRRHQQQGRTFSNRCQSVIPWFGGDR